MLKFTHGVEIGAHQAYIGHYVRTGDVNVFQIACDEVVHRWTVRFILARLGEEPSPIIDGSFRFISGIIRRLCAISPIFLLNIVARLLEVFAVISYDKLAQMYPEWRNELIEMAVKEDEHRLYFKELK